MQDSGRDSKPGVGARNMTAQRVGIVPPVGEPITLTVAEGQCKRCLNVVPALLLWDGRCVDCGW